MATFHPAEPCGPSHWARRAERGRAADMGGGAASWPQGAAALTTPRVTCLPGPPPLPAACISPRPAAAGEREAHWQALPSLTQPSSPASTLAASHTHHTARPGVVSPLPRLFPFLIAFAVCVGHPLARTRGHDRSRSNCFACFMFIYKPDNSGKRGPCRAWHSPAHSPRALRSAAPLLKIGTPDLSPPRPRRLGEAMGGEMKET